MVINKVNKENIDRAKTKKKQKGGELRDSSQSGKNL